MVGRFLSGLVAALVVFLEPADAASRRECKASACRPQITACKQGCSSVAKRKRARCRAKCKGQVTRACRTDQQPCGGSGGRQCAAYTSDAPAASLLDATLDPAPICTVAVGSLPACTASFQSRLGLLTPMKTTEGECCVIDGCLGVTAFGIYNLFGGTGDPNPPITAPVLVSVDYQSSYFERPPGNQFDPGQWQHTTGSGGTVQCLVTVPNVLAAAGFRHVYMSSELAAPYASRPATPPEPNWLAPWVLGAGDTTVAIAGTAEAPNDIVRPGSAKPHMWDLDPLLFITVPNPPVEVLSERFSVDKVSADEVIVSAFGTFRRRDGSECSVTIHARASTRCDTADQCLGGHQCVDGRCEVAPGVDPIGR